MVSFRGTDPETHGAAILLRDSEAWKFER